MNNIDIFGNEKEEGVASTATTNNNNQENITNSINNINAVPSVILKSINVVDIINTFIRTTQDLINLIKINPTTTSAVMYPDLNVVTNANVEFWNFDGTEHVNNNTLSSSDQGVTLHSSSMTNNIPSDLASNNNNLTLHDIVHDIVRDDMDDRNESLTLHSNASCIINNPTGIIRDNTDSLSIENTKKKNSTQKKRQKKNNGEKQMDISKKNESIIDGQTMIPHANTVLSADAICELDKSIPELSLKISKVTNKKTKRTKTNNTELVDGKQIIPEKKRRVYKKKEKKSVVADEQQQQSVQEHSSTS